LQFYIIVNPANGPGPANSQPNGNYRDCITSLRAAGAVNNNLKILGYVPTEFGAHTPAVVVSKINTYSQWSPAYRPDGIFFDQASRLHSRLALYQCYASHVHTAFGTSFIILNQGVTPPPHEPKTAVGYHCHKPGVTKPNNYFDIADMIVTFQGFYNNFDPSSSLTIGPSTPAQKQAVILHDGPAELPFLIVDQLAGILGVGASFITNFPKASAFQNIPSYWNSGSFLGLLIGAQTA